ncbi:DUF2959 domain-containing protein [Glaciecola petra]|uniref:DUF2959 domain-containing protein n=1 Tax=Glaciecola petra TaxID=3075602 RepID=A0ABU2ZS29_9ALTE|nr:DUF2959 domain-containing protein [Aestuariibacter sp. P117]MDT0595443.1 DUF2959 domain-containing protein [Aestuariibacter sp. P117]
MKQVLVFGFISLFALTGCKSTVQDAYFNMWEKIGFEKREILVDRVEDAQESQQEAQEQFASALEEFSTLINFDGGELEEVYGSLNDQFEASQESAQDVTDRIDKVQNVAESLFREWAEEIELISNANLKRDSARQMKETQRKYDGLLRSMRKVEGSMQPVLTALQDNVLYLKHNLNANAIGALQGELSTIKRDVNVLLKEMNAAISQSDEFIKTLQSE